MTDVVMPQLGETVTEGTITKWFKQVGDAVAEDEVLFEVSTDKVDSEVPSPVGGVVAEILVAEGETAEVGTALAVVSTDGAPAAPAPAEPEATAEPEPEPAPAPAPPASEPPASAASEPAPAPPPTPSAPPSAPVPVPTPAPSAAPAGGPAPLVSPIVRRLATEHDLDLSAISGTGVGGRITRGDVERAIQPTPAGEPSAPTSPLPAAATPGADVRVPLNNIRRRTGEHMRQSKDLSPHAFTVVEVDFEGVERARRDARTSFRRDEGFSLTYLPFIARAVVDAIREFPHMNASLGEGDLIVHQSINLAIAVDLDFEGLVAPVVRDADQKRLRAIAHEIHDLAQRARSKQLSPDEITGGTFTLTNAGSYGTHMVLPIINQPQVAILSTDGIKRRPVVVTTDDGSEAIAIHSVGMLPMSWDHRAFDGAYAAAFLARVREILETRDWSAEL